MQGRLPRGSISRAYQRAEGEGSCCCGEGTREAATDCRNPPAEFTEHFTGKEAEIPRDKAVSSTARSQLRTSETKTSPLIKTY